MKFVALVVVTSSEYEDKFKSIAKKSGVGGATIFQAKGSGSSENKSFFSITFEGNQSVLLYILEEKLSKTLLKSIHTEITSNKSDCIAFTMPISHIVGLDREVLKKFENSIKNQNDL
jgi:hypothetical protein